MKERPKGDLWTWGVETGEIRIRVPSDRPGEPFILHATERDLDQMKEAIRIGRLR